MVCSPLIRLAIQAMSAGDDGDISGRKHDTNRSNVYSCIFFTFPTSSAPVPNTLRLHFTMSAMKERLSGKTILITGASSGIGASTAIEFARTSPDSLRLVLAARRVDKLTELSSKITKDFPGVKVYTAQLDVSKPEEVKKFVGTLPAEFQEIDVLVNNAGLAKGTAQAPNISDSDISQMWETNVTGLINMTQAILPIFKKRPDGGAGDIINIGSIAGREGYPGGSVYCASKAAVRSFSEALRKELISTRIRIIVIDPGQVETVRPLLEVYQNLIANS